MSKEKKYKSSYKMKEQKHKTAKLEPGMKGFLCSCNFREKECVRESYNILNHYADKLAGKCDEPTTAVTESDSNEVEEDLKKEIAGLKEEGKNPKIRRFQVVESGARNFLFISSTIDDPTKLGETIVKAIHESQEQQVRFLLRLVPIEVVCRANIADLKRAFQPLVDKYFGDSPHTFSIAFNHRNNNSISRDDVIKELADMVTQKRSDHSVNLKDAELTVVVEIVRGMALLSVLPEYLKYKKYNLHISKENEDVVEQE